MQQKLIVVSMDALIYEDLEYLRIRPNFARLMKNCAAVQRVRSIYPTLTYPCHAAMTTGCYPTTHGVFNNTVLTPGALKAPWLWYHDAYKVKDLFDACKEKGLCTASIGWPSTGCHPHVDYLVDEIAATTAKTSEEYRRDYLLTGTPQWLWEEICVPHIHWRTEKKRVAMFNGKVCSEINRRFAPDLTLLHLANPDRERHTHGVFAPEVRNGLDECEEILGWLLQAIEDSGAAEQYNLVVTADHGQLDTYQVANPNVLFASHGLLTVDEAGNVADWRAWSATVGMCATVFVKEPADKPAVFDLLKRHEGLGFAKIYTQTEAAAEGYGGSFDFVLETDGKTSFENNWQGAYLVQREKVKGSHGFHPDKGPRPTMLCMGAGFRTGAVIPGANLVDGAPTWAKLLSVALPDADGKAVDALLR